MPAPPVVPGPGDTENFFPDAVGNEWYYDSTETDTMTSGVVTDSFQQMSVAGTRNFGTVVAKVFRSSRPDDPSATFDTYLSRDADGVTNHGNNDPSDTLTASIVPYLEGRFPVATGVVTELARSDVDFGQDIDGDGRTERANFTLRITVDGFESQAVPAGAFSRTVKRLSQTTGTVVTTRSGSVPFSATETLWSAPGAGIVRQTIAVTAGSQSQQQTLSARGYKVDGVGHGLGLPGPFIVGLVPASSDVYMPGPPAVASGSSGFLLSTIRQTGLQSMTPITKIVAAFGDAEGRLVREVDVTSPVASLMGGKPLDAAFDGTNFMILYSEGTVNTTANPLLVTRISPSGVLLDGSAGIQIDGGSASSAAMAYGASTYLVVFTRYDSGLSLHQLFGRLITPAGNPIGTTAFPIGVRSRNQLHPDVAFDGTQFLVTWQQDEPLSTPGPLSVAPAVMAARVTEAGAVLEPGGFAVSVPATGAFAPRVAFGGGQYLVAWEDRRRTVTGTVSTPAVDIYGARVSTSGVLLDGPAATGALLLMSNNTNTLRKPSVVNAGSGFLVTWATGSYPGVSGAAGVYGTRVSAAGAVTPDTNSGIKLSGSPAATGARYEFPQSVRVGSRAVIAWLENTEANGAAKGIRVLPVYSLE